MKETRLIMGMPITAELLGGFGVQGLNIPLPDLSAEMQKIFAYFTAVDERFSTYKKESEISRINRGELSESEWSAEMKEVFALCEQTKKETDGYFDIVNRKGVYDPSGLVKGWAIYRSAEMVRADGFKHFFIEAGGDIQSYGKNAEGKKWRVGIRNPFNEKEVIKVLEVDGEGVATSGTYVRGQHIYNPKKMAEDLIDIVSLTVIGPNIYEADRFATAAFAMGKRGIEFIEQLSGFEGYQIDKDGIAVMTSGFEKYVVR